MEHKQIIYGEYVLTPCKNAFNRKTSYWISRKDHTIAVYAFTPMDARDLKEHCSEPYIKSYISLFENIMKTYSNGVDAEKKALSERRGK